MFRLPSSATFDSWEGLAAEKASQSPSPSTHTQVGWHQVNAKAISIKTFYFALLKISNSFPLSVFILWLLKYQTNINQPFLFCTFKNTKPESIKLFLVCSSKYQTKINQPFYFVVLKIPNKNQSSFFILLF
jgi:hypothetical protein